MIQFMACMAVVCALSGFFLVIKASLPIPDHANHLILLNDDLMESFFDTYDLSDMWIVTMLSGSLEDDAYLPLHMGGIMEATINLPNVFFIFYQFSPTNNFVYSLGKFFSKLPDTSIIVSVQHGYNRIQIPYLEYLVQSKIIKPHIIFHLNHEKPWEEELSLDFIYPTIGELQNAYSSQKLVIRNYYYEPLLGSSLYLPVGVPFRSRTFLNESSRWYRARHKHSLESRNRFCFFKGRLRYNSSVDTKLNDERQSIFSLKLQQNKLQMCTVEVLTERETMSMTAFEAIDQFLEIMVDTVFALCPGGNNPETFRMFEVPYIIVNPK